MIEPNTVIRPLYWEPVVGGGDRLSVGVLYRHDGDIGGRVILREDVLKCLYGKSAATAAGNLLNTAVDTLIKAANAVGIDGSIPKVFGVSCGESRLVHAYSVTDAIRIAALLYSSLATLPSDDELEADDAQSQDESNSGFLKEIIEHVKRVRPSLVGAFNQRLVLLEQGSQVRFGFYNNHALFHFSTMIPLRQAACVRDARARLWELANAVEHHHIEVSALIMGAPSHDDPTISQRQINTLKANLREIEREADRHNILFFPRPSARSAADVIVELA